jgi:hypothetical protein
VVAAELIVFSFSTGFAMEFSFDSFDAQPDVAVRGTTMLSAPSDGDSAITRHRDRF